MKNRELLETFITENLDHAYRLAYSYTKEAASAEDVVSESIVKALRFSENLKDQKHVRAWFFRIVINTAITYLNKEKRMVHLENPEEIEEKFVVEDSSEITITEFIDLLEPQYKSVIILRFFEDMTLEEIAKTLSVNINTVKTRLYRGLKLLRLEMEEA